jgi:hypothetical protein
VEKPNLSVDGAREPGEQGGRRLIAKRGGSFPGLPRGMPQLGEGALNGGDVILVTGGSGRIKIEERAYLHPLWSSLRYGAERSKPLCDEVAELFDLACLRAQLPRFGKARIFEIPQRAS